MTVTLERSETENLTIRGLETKDVQPVLELEWLTCSDPWTHDELHSIMMKERVWGYVIHDARIVKNTHRHILGFMVVEYFPSMIEIINLVVLPRVQRHGVGTSLLSMLKIKNYTVFADVPNMLTDAACSSVPTNLRAFMMTVITIVLSIEGDEMKKRLWVKNHVRSAWSEHKITWNDCQRCPLCVDRDKVVLFRGYMPCDILFIGDAPGPSENVIGHPLVGPSGNILDGIIGDVINRTSPFRFGITNIVGCFPPTEDREIRPPTKQEVKTCLPRLQEIIAMTKPDHIVTLGAVAKKYIPKVEQPVTNIMHPANIARQSGVPAIVILLTLCTFVG